MFKFLGNQNTAEDLFGRPGPATEQEIIDFIYDEEDRFPTMDEVEDGTSKYTVEEIKEMIVRDETDDYFDQILDGVLHHRNGNRHPFVKTNLSDKGKVLHIKNKLYFCAQQNQMKYRRVIDLILSARVLVHDIDDSFQKASDYDADKELARKTVLDKGKELVGEEQFNIFIDRVLYDMNYGKIAEKYGIKKSKVSDIINDCLAKLRNSEVLQELYQELVK
jgi:predicted DNA-binding protein YlxM (UPF0122 family)